MKQSLLNDMEMRELDAFCAEHVMCFKKVDSWRQLNPDSNTFWIDGDGDVVLSPKKFSIYVTAFSPTVTPADALAVLKKCAEKVEQSEKTIGVERLPKGAWRVMQFDILHDGYDFDAEAETLEAAIAKFAHSLYSK